MTITYLDPRAEPGIAVDEYTARSLDPGVASTIGLLANGFPDSVAFLDHVERALLNVAPPGSVVKRYAKPNASASIADELLRTIVAECNGLVTAYGH